MIVLRRPAPYLWPKVYANPYAGVDDDRARASLGPECGGPYDLTDAAANRAWCDLLHRGRWPE
jgi:hypothetical protein